LIPLLDYILAVQFDETKKFISFLTKIFRYAVITNLNRECEMQTSDMLNLIDDAYVANNLCFWIDECECLNVYKHNRTCPHNSKTYAIMESVLEKLHSWKTTSQDNISYLNELIHQINRLIIRLR